MIAGNHEPFHRLRTWKPEYFAGKLNYTHAGELSHSIPDLSVYGLSGIFHPDELQFMTESEKRRYKISGDLSWSEIVELAQKNAVSPELLQPQFACCGHHHSSAAFEMGVTQIRALNIIARIRLHRTHPLCDCESQCVLKSN